MFTREKTEAYPGAIAVSVNAGRWAAGWDMGPFAEDPMLQTSESVVLNLASVTRLPPGSAQECRIDTRLGCGAVCGNSIRRAGGFSVWMWAGAGGQGIPGTLGGE
jgi:hypothetical protein